MYYLACAVIYTGFFALIGAAVYWTDSAWPLWALLLTPSMSSRKTSGDKEGKDSNHVD